MNLLNVHAGHDTEIIRIWNRSYKDVRGLNPCYLRIGDRPLILFVTGKSWDHGQATVHLANTLTREVQEFPAYDSRIGDNIGATDPERFEKVESVDGDTLIITARFLDRHFRYVIDLKAPRFVREEGSYMSSISKKRETYVHEEGRTPVR